MLSNGCWSNPNSTQRTNFSNVVSVLDPNRFDIEYYNMIIYTHNVVLFFVSNLSVDVEASAYKGEN